MIRSRTVAATSIALAAMILIAPHASAFEARLMKESLGAKLGTSGCPLPTNTDGTAANYRWYNVCSGYIWIFAAASQGEGMGVLFGGPEQPEVNDSNVVKRAITYWRNVVPNYSQTVDIFVDLDSGDGCPDSPWLEDLNLDPGLRWNCSEFAAQIPAGIEYLIVRHEHDGGAGANPATDGPFSQQCDPPSTPHSYYYGINLSACIPWIGPDGTDDNFLYWLILDSPAPNAVEPSTWGAIKGLFR